MPHLFDYSRKKYSLFLASLQKKPCVLKVLLSPSVNLAGMYNALTYIRAFVDFIGDAALNSNPVQKNLTANIHSLKVLFII